MQTYLVFDIGGTFIKYALMRENCAILDKGKVHSPLDSLESLLNTMVAVGEIYTGQYAGVAVSMPGSTDTKNGIVHTGGAFAFIHDVPLAAMLEERMGVPATIANDAYCAANAEAWNGALADVDSGCVVVLDTGIGGGIVLNGKVWMGSTFSAGQFSALPADFEGIYKGMLTPDVPGLFSLWTGLVSTTSLLHTYAMRKGLSAEESQDMDGVAFFAAYDAGEPEAADALKIFGRQAAAGIYTIQAVLDLQRFAIGGGISAKPEVTNIIRKTLDELFALFPATPFAKPEIVTCRYGNDVNLIGALRFHLEAN